jgi:hypothetical protein
MINEEVNKCHRKILKWKQKLKDIQDVCTHEGAAKVAKGDTGNWCKDDDSYWYEFDCPVCCKFWSEPQ